MEARIQQVALVPVPDEIRAEEVFACIVVESDILPTMALANAILSTAANQLAYYKLPGNAAFLDSLPLTTTQKPRFGALTERANSLLAKRSPLVFDVRHVQRNLRSIQLPG